MKIATWNVNSIRAREERLIRWLGAHQPDVLCLQELKVQDADFPVDAVREAGYEAAFHGQKTYNGVAILARTPPEDVREGLGDDVDDPQARLLSVRVDGVRVISAYVPNGSTIESDKYAYKLAWLGRLREYLERDADPGDDVALCGDFNVAPEDLDVCDPAGWADSVLCHDDARSALARVADWGLTDTFRPLHPDEPIFSWWDYRQLAFPRNQGLRIDHVYATASLAATATEAFVDRDERKGKKPSDHAPVVVTFDR